MMTRRKTIARLRGNIDRLKAKYDASQIGGASAYYKWFGIECFMSMAADYTITHDSRPTITSVASKMWYRWKYRHVKNELSRRLNAL